MLKKLSEQFMAHIPSNYMPTDALKREWQEWLTHQLHQQGFVSREEFDIQSQVLLRTRHKIEVLEQRIALLEATL